MSVGSMLSKLPIPKSAKEKALIGAVGPAMSMIEEFTKDIKPNNEISDFLQANFHLLFITRESDDTMGVSGLITKMLIAEANADPEFVEHKLLGFYEEFRAFYRGYLERKKV